MTHLSLSPFAVFAGIVMLAVLAFAWRRHVLRQRVAARVQAENRERQEFLVARIDAITTLLADEDMPLPELEARTAELVSEMQSRNLDGALDPLIDDTRASLSEEFQKRRAGGLAGRK